MVFSSMGCGLGIGLGPLVVCWKPVPSGSSTVFVSNDVYLARCRSGHPVRHSRYFNKYFIRYDGMDILDHRGVTSVVAGSIVMKLVRQEHRLGSNQPTPLSNINAMIKKHQDEHPVSARMPKLRPQDLVSDGWDDMSGNLIKAGNTRSLAPALLSPAIMVFDDPGNQYHLAIVDLIRSLNGVYDTLYTAGIFLTSEETTRLQRDLDTMGRSHMRCRQFAARAGEMAFQVKPKAYYAQHLSFQARLINPRYTQCYQEESMMGVMAKVFKRSCSGLYVKTAQSTWFTGLWYAKCELFRRTGIVLTSQSSDGR